MAEDLITVGTGYHGLGMAEDSGNVKATLALDIHKVRVGPLHQALLLVHGLLRGGERVEQVHNQLHFVRGRRKELVDCLTTRERDARSRPPPARVKDQRHRPVTLPSCAARGQSILGTQ